MPKLNIYDANRYVIAANLQKNKVKLFQINFSKKDGSLFLMFPYLKGCPCRIGEIRLQKGIAVFENIRVGDNFPVSSHQVKYAHHTSGQAHFSLTGKVRNEIKTRSVALSETYGHIFTAVFQGLQSFDQLEAHKPATKSRGVVPFPFDAKPVECVKIVGFIYSESELVKRAFFDKPGSPWFKMISPNGQVKVGIVLNTTITHNGEKRYLLLAASRESRQITNKDRGIIFTGGFDSEDHVNDYSKESSLLMMFVNDSANFAEIAKEFGTIDLK